LSDDSNVLHLPVRLTVEANPDVNLEAINRLTLEPVTAEEIFTFSGNCSNDRLDSYFTRMDPVTTLRNYVDDLKTGVSLLEGHDIRKNPYGRSYDGALIPATDAPDSFNAARGHWYIMRGLTINGSNTDDTIKAIKAGIIRDMSVGFGGDRMWYRCSSCGRDLWRDRDCPHIPSLEDENGRITFAWVVDARLREVSTVYKGATPGAYIDKARQYVEQGQLSQKNIAILERHYQVRLDDGKRSIFMPKKEDGSVNFLEQLRQALKEGKLEKRSVYDVLSAEGEKFRQPDDVLLRNELGDSATVDGVRQLKSEAEQGRQYVADLIDKAVQARVRAQGEGFNAESYKNMLVRSADLDYIKDEIKSYDELAKNRYKPGRQSEEDDLGGGTPPERKEENSFKDENIFG
jgi:hypothetical protein